MWDEREKLANLLPRLQGSAGEFVFDQLSQRVRDDYFHLTKELKARFRVVETCKTFRSSFSLRDQNQGETPEKYAAELKRLYDKGWEATSILMLKQRIKE